MPVQRAVLMTIVICAGLLLYVAVVAAQEPTPLTPPPFPTATPSDVPTATPLSEFPTATPLFLPTPTITPTPAPAPNVAMLTCHAEPRWTFLVNVRRGPSSNWGITRILAHNMENQEMWVFGRNETNDWFHVVLPEPFEEEVGWVWLENINLFGKCDELPVTEDNPEITIDEVPDPPEPIPMPDFVEDHVTLGPWDRAFLVRPGILYIRREVPGDEKERMQAHIVLYDLDSPELDIGVSIGAVPDIEGVPVSTMARNAGAFAGITGDYYAGNYFPQGITVIDGQVVTAPKLRSAFGLTKDREPFIGYFTDGWSWPASVTAENGEVIPLQLMNVPCERAWLCLYSHHRANRLPASYAGVRVLLDPDFEVLEIVDNEGIDIPHGHFALRGGDAAGQWLLNNVEVGDTLDIALPTTPDWRDFQTIISGGPRIVIDGEYWQECVEGQEPFVCEEFDEDHRIRHTGPQTIPRAAVGMNEEDNIIYTIMVEGYEVEDSNGAMQSELADMFIEFGATQAMEFDGGGSATFYMDRGSISDHGYEGERRISNALLFFWNDDED